MLNTEPIESMLLTALGKVLKEICGDTVAGVFHKFNAPNLLRWFLNFYLGFIAVRGTNFIFFILLGMMDYYSHSLSQCSGSLRSPNWQSS